jgi:nucleotide-binding universal stress UspA family protein
MGAYTTIIVGTDGSATSFAAVDKAAELARDSGATLVIACAYEPINMREVAAATHALGAELFQIVGSAPAEANVGLANDRAVAAGATSIKTDVVQGRPADVLIEAAKKHEANLLVIGNRGLNTLAGRIIGSVPLDVARHAAIDVLIVHTT